MPATENHAAAEMRFIAEIKAAGNNPDAMLRQQVISAIYGISRPWMYALISQGKFPAPTKYGRSSRWRAGDVQAAMARLSEAAAA